MVPESERFSSNMRISSETADQCTLKIFSVRSSISDYLKWVPQVQSKVLI